MISMAALQGHLLVHKSSPARAIESLPVSGPSKAAIHSDSDTLLDEVRLPLPMYYKLYIDLAQVYNECMNNIVYVCLTMHICMH